jgi:hypothetical protein
MTEMAKRIILGSVFVMIAVAMTGLSGAAENGWVAGKIGDNSLFPFAGNPIAGATVSDANGATSATTAADGSFNLTLPEGNYTLKVSASGYNDKVSGTIKVTANKTTSYNTYLSVPSGNLTGKVTEDDGSPMIMATVSCNNVSGYTSTDGKYTLSGIPVGTWTLSVTPIMGTPINYTVTIANGQTTTKDIQIATPSPAVFSVLDQDDKAITGASVSFGNQTGTTDANGAVTLNGLKPGSYTLTVTAKGYKTYTSTQTLDKGGNIFKVPMSKPSTGGGGKGFIPGFEAVSLLAVVALAGIVIRRKSGA